MVWERYHRFRTWAVVSWVLETRVCRHSLCETRSVRVMCPCSRGITKASWEHLKDYLQRSLTESMHMSPQS